MITLEKAYKPVPKAKALAYKGTPDKPDIKIFVSHRIDQDSVTIDNPLFIPVRCGAVYDDRENVEMLGDDTGDNISEKRMSFCEFTVIYWAWKNVKADYYGLCHYRRYLSFLDHDVPYSVLKQGLIDSMSRINLEKCGLLNEKNMRRVIQENDVIAPYEYTLEDAADYVSKTVREHWENNWRCYLKDEDFELLLELIRKHAPEYYQSAKEYMAGNKFVGFNCCVMKKEYFHKFCEFIFPIMFEFDDSIDKSNYSDTQNRAVGYAGEWLFSIFLYHNRKNKTFRIENRQLLSFLNTEKVKELKPIEAANSIPIVIGVRDGNRPLIGVQLRSILENASPNKIYDIILLHQSYGTDRFLDTLRSNEDQILLDMAKDYENVTIRLYDPKDNIGEAEIHNWGEASFEESYYLPLLPWILNAYEKSIFLGESMLLHSDIAELFDTDIKGKFAAGVKSPYFAAMLNGYSSGFKKTAEEKLGMNDLYNFVTTDIVVMNLKCIRENFTRDQIIKTMKRHQMILNDAFNVLFEKKMMFLPQNWYKIDCAGPEYFGMQDYIPHELSVEQKMPVKAFCMRGIYGQWVTNQSKGMRNFWTYARKTEFYEQLLMMFESGAFSAMLMNYDASKIDGRTGARKIADKLLPPNTRRRKIAKALIPRGSLQWRFFKQIYYVIRPEYRPQKNTK